MVPIRYVKAMDEQSVGMSTNGCTEDPATLAQEFRNA